MKFGRAGMTGAGAALCSDTVRGDDNVNFYKLPHLCTSVPLFRNERVFDGSVSDF